MHLKYTPALYFLILGLSSCHVLESSERNNNTDLTKSDLPITERSSTMLDMLTEIIKRLDDHDKHIKVLEEGKKLEACPDGWYKNGKSCYYFSNYKISWFDSMIFCMGFQGYLAEINDYSENVYLKQRVKQLNGNFWIGGTDLVKENHWIWAKSQTRLTTSMFLDWDKGQPDNHLNDEHCMDLRYTRNGWNDYPCHLSQNYICERELQ